VEIQQGMFLRGERRCLQEQVCRTPVQVLFPNTANGKHNCNFW